MSPTLNITADNLSDIGKFIGINDRTRCFRVCRQWSRVFSKDMKEMHEGYHPEIVDALHHKGISLNCIPMYHGSIPLIRLSSDGMNLHNKLSGMSSSLIRFKTNSFGQAGLAIRVVPRRALDVPLQPQELEFYLHHPWRQQSLCPDMILHPNSMLAARADRYAQIHDIMPPRIYEYEVSEAWQKKVGPQVAKDWVVQLIHDTEPNFRLNGPIGQIEPTSIPPQTALAMRALDARRSAGLCWSKLTTVRLLAFQFLRICILVLRQMIQYDMRQIGHS